MKLNMKSVSELKHDAGKIVRCTYDTGVSWDKIAHAMALNYLIEQQRANQYAAANAALSQKLDESAHQTQPVYQDRLRPGDPRADFPGGQPVLKTFSAAHDIWGATALVNAHELSCPCFVGNPRDGVYCGRGCPQCVCPKLTAAVTTGRTSSSAANVSNEPKEQHPEAGRLAWEPVPPETAAPAAPRLTVYFPTPEERAASEQALRRIAQASSPEIMRNMEQPGMIAD